jgi:hypothetical protein
VTAGGGGRARVVRVARGVGGDAAVLGSGLEPTVAAAPYVELGFQRLGVVTAGTLR